MATAMSSMAGANGIRAWLGRRGFSWLNPVRLRRVTVGLFSAALLASALLMSGSSAAPAPAHPHAAAANDSR